MYDIKNLTIWKEEPQNDKSSEMLSNLDITELNLSQRPYNCLRRAGCTTVGDVLDLIEDDETGLRRIRNLGSVSEKEIIESIERLRSQYPVGQMVRSQSSPNGTTVRILLQPAKKLWNTDIASFHLSEASLARLHASGIRYVRDLYTTKSGQEPGWYAVRELFSKITV